MDCSATVHGQGSVKVINLKKKEKKMCRMAPMSGADGASVFCSVTYYTYMHQRNPLITLAPLYQMDTCDVTAIFSDKWGEITHKHTLNSTQ